MRPIHSRGLPTNQRTLLFTGPVAATIQMETQLCLSASEAERNPWGGVSKGAQWEERSANEGIYCQAILKLLSSYCQANVQSQNVPCFDQISSRNTSSPTENTQNTSFSIFHRVRESVPCFDQITSATHKNMSSTIQNTPFPSFTVRSLGKGKRTLFWSNNIRNS